MLTTVFVSLQDDNDLVFDEEINGLVASWWTGAAADEKRVKRETPAALDVDQPVPSNKHHSSARSGHHNGSRLAAHGLWNHHKKKHDAKSHAKAKPELKSKSQSKHASKSHSKAKPKPASNRTAPLLKIVDDEDLMLADASGSGSGFPLLSDPIVTNWQSE